MIFSFFESFLFGEPSDHFPGLADDINFLLLAFLSLIYHIIVAFEMEQILDSYIVHGI